MLQNRFSENYLEVGCDEAGRGCLAGPVFAGAVILPDDFYHPLLNDSKQLTEKQRELLRPIIEKEAVEWAVVAVSAEEIDQINILNASIIGMHRCIDQLVTQPYRAGCNLFYFRRRPKNFLIANLNYYWLLSSFGERYQNAEKRLGGSSYRVSS